MRYAAYINPILELWRAFPNEANSVRDGDKAFAHLSLHCSHIGYVQSY